MSTQQPPPPPPYQPAKRLVRTRDSRWLGGVCGGWARYLGIDATLVRVLVILAFVFTGFFPIGIIYLVAWAVTPQG